MQYSLILLLIFFVPLFWSKDAYAFENCPSESVSILISVQGTIVFDANGNGNWLEANLNQPICEGSRIWVKSDSRGSLLLPGNDVLRLNENTILTLKTTNLNKTSVLDVVKGFLYYLSRKPKEVKIESGIANAAPLGTEFAFRVDDAKASLWVYEGDVRFFNQQGSITLKPGQAAQAQLGKAPRYQVDIRPEDAVNWALYYPPLLPYPQDLKQIDPALSTTIQEFRQGRTDIALARLDTLTPTQHTPYFYPVRAAMRLIVGQVEPALQDIRTLQTLNPNDANAFALQSVIALSQDRKDEAYRLANKAVASAPQSATAYSALSYAEQGRFQLDKALAAATQAVNYAPQDAMVLARKAELELALGLMSDSEATAKKALSLDPNLARTQTVAGFTDLRRMDADDAIQRFTNAIRLDSTSPLARLGLGLAKIRNGDLAEGRQDIEIAAVLDPNNSLIRSYLGKAYFEEKRNARAEDQFKLAEERDPKDPTPYFYDAIKKQTENRPVEALRDLQEAIKLNDNRLVYRSKQMLDSDYAARGAALGRIYNELGFGARGLVEGWRSVAEDPTDYTSHRLLSDSYAALPRHDLARSSELLQSQLLQPINITPVQPRLAESQLFLLGGLGPSALSMNEFNPSFQRNRFSLLSSGMVGSNDTYSDEVVHSGLWNNFSYSLGQFHYQTQGFRKNNDIDANVYNAFAQASVTPELSVQAEYRHRDVDHGSLVSLFLPPSPFLQQNYFDIIRASLESDTYRFGVHYTPTNHSDLLGSFIHIDQLTTNGTRDTVDSVFSNRALVGEGQYIHHLESVKTILGGGYNHLDTSESILQNSYGYLYTHINLPSEVTWTLGVNVSYLNDPQFPDPIRTVLPKFGVLWNITPDTLIRAAYFRTLNGKRIPYQTLEPIQIGGFNQVFDDNYRTNAARWGIGLDHKFNAALSAGIEVSRRYLDAHALIENEKLELVEAKTPQRESQYRAYVLWAPYPRWAGTVEYLRENFYGNNMARNTRTQTVPVSLSYFHPNGLFAKFKTNFYYQAVDTDTVPQSDSAVFLDLNLGYRLPKRYGIFELQFQNLLDQSYRYEGLHSRQDFDSNAVPPFMPFPPEFTVFGRLTLAL